MPDASMRLFWIDHDIYRSGETIQTTRGERRGEAVLIITIPARKSLIRGRCDPFLGCPRLVDCYATSGSVNHGCPKVRTARLADQLRSAVLECFNPALWAKRHQDRKVAFDCRAIKHLPGLRALNKCTGIENVRCFGEPNTLDPCGIDNIDREPSQNQNLNATSPAD